MEHATLTGCGRGDKTSVSERSTTSPPRLDRWDTCLPWPSLSMLLRPLPFQSPGQPHWRLRRCLLKGCDRLFRPSCPPGTLLQRPLPATGPPLRTLVPLPPVPRQRARQMPPPPAKPTLSRHGSSSTALDLSALALPPPPTPPPLPAPTTPAPAVPVLALSLPPGRKRPAPATQEKILLPQPCSRPGLL